MSAVNARKPQEPFGRATPSRRALLLLRVVSTQMNRPYRTRAMRRVLHGVGVDAGVLHPECLEKYAAAFLGRHKAIQYNADEATESVSRDAACAGTIGIER